MAIKPVQPADSPKELFRLIIMDDGRVEMQADQEMEFSYSEVGDVMASIRLNLLVGTLVRLCGEALLEHADPERPLDITQEEVTGEES